MATEMWKDHGGGPQKNMFIIYTGKTTESNMGGVVRGMDYMDGFVTGASIGMIPVYLPLLH